MTKCCTTCKEYKDESQFSFRNKAKGRRHSVCKQCHKEVRTKHYKDNKEQYKDRATKWNKNNTKRKSILRNSYAKLKGYIKCECCNQKDIDKFLQQCPKGYDVDHILNTWEGGRHCLKNLQYLVRREHNSKSGKEGAYIRW